MRTVKGVITASTTNGNTSSVDLSSVFSATQPLRAVILWAGYNTAEGTVATARFSMGMATNDGGSIQQGGYAIFDLGDNAGTQSDVWHAMNTTWALRGFSDAAGTVDYEIDVTSFSDTGFTLTYTDAPASAIKIHYWAIGGSEVDKARVHNVAVSTTSPQSVTINTGWGQPDLLIGLGSVSGLTDGIAPTNAGQLSVGVAASDTVRQTSILASRDGQNTMTVASVQKQRFLATLNNASTTFEYELDLDAVGNWPTDGYQLVKPDLPSGVRQIIVLALQGSFQYALGVDTALTSGSTDDIAAGFAPAGALLWGTNLAASSTPTATAADLGHLVVGATDGTNEGHAIWHSDDAATEANADVTHSESKAIAFYDAANPPAKQSEADASFNGNNLRLTWSDLDTVAREYNYLILGPLGASSNSSRDARITGQATTSESRTAKIVGGAPAATDSRAARTTGHVINGLFKDLDVGSQTTITVNPSGIPWRSNTLHASPQGDTFTTVPPDGAAWDVGFRPRQAGNGLYSTVARTSDGKVYSSNIRIGGTSGTVEPRLANILVFDSFNSASGTVLSSHTGQTGATWTKNSVSESGAALSILSGLIRSSGSASTTAIYNASATPASADYDVTALFRRISTSSGHISIMGRASTSAYTGYRLTASNTDGEWILSKVVGGTITELDTWSGDFEVGVDYQAKLEMRGSTIKGYINGVERLSATDSSITSAGTVAIQGVDDQGTGGWQIDAISAGVNPSRLILGTLIDNDIRWTGYFDTAAFNYQGARANSTTYGTNAHVNYNGKIWRALLGGTTASSPPGGMDTGDYGASVFDGGVLWFAYGRYDGAWTSSTSYQGVVTNAARTYCGPVCVTTNSNTELWYWSGSTSTWGRTGTTEPAWGSALDSAKYWIDNEVLWIRGSDLYGQNIDGGNERLILTGLAAKANGTEITFENTGSENHDIVLADRYEIAESFALRAYYQHLVGSDAASTNPFDFGGVSQRIEAGQSFTVVYSTSTGLWTRAATQATYSDSFRKARIFGVAGSNSSRAARITGTATASDSRAASITGTITTSESRAAKISGVAGANDSRTAKIVGQAVASDSRTAQTVGQATASDSRAARVTGVGGASVVVSWAEVSIPEAAFEVSDSRPARITGRPSFTASDSRAARVTGTDTASSSRAARITGAAATAESRTARVTGTAVASDSRTAKIVGQITTSDSRAARVTGQAAASDSRAARITGALGSNDSRTAKITGQAVASDARTAKVTGIVSAADSRAARIVGSASASSARVVSIAVEGAVVSRRDTRITGTAVTSDSRAARVTGQVAATDTRTAKVVGAATVSDSRAAKIVGTAVTSDTRTAQVRGQETVSSSRGAAIFGEVHESSSRAARITGLFEGVESVRAARVFGVYAAESSRPARITGRTRLKVVKPGPVGHASVRGISGRSDVKGTIQGVDVTGASGRTDVRQGWIRTRINNETED